MDQLSGPRRSKPSRLAVVSFLIGTTSLGLGIYFNVFKGPKRADESKKAILKEVQEVRQKTLEVDLAHKYQDRLENSTPESEVAAARGTLEELQTVSNQYRENRDPLATWIRTDHLSNPEYLEVLHEARLIDRRDVPKKGSENEDGDSYEDTHYERRWRINESGEKALAKNDFHQLLAVIEESQKRGKEYGLVVNHVLFGRYLGVGLVTESSYGGCDDWDRGEDTPPENRIYGWIKVDVLAGSMWRRRPYKAGENVLAQSNVANDVGIRGCPKRGDIVGFVWRPYNEIWEKVFVPPPQILVGEPK